MSGSTRLWTMVLQPFTMSPFCIHLGFSPPPGHIMGYILHVTLLVYFLQAYAHGSALKGWKLDLEPCCEIWTVKWHQSFPLLIESTTQLVCFPSAHWGSSTHERLYVCTSANLHFCPWGVVPGAGWTLHTGKFVKTTSHVVIDLYNTCNHSCTCHGVGGEERHLPQCPLTSAQRQPLSLTVSRQAYNPKTTDSVKHQFPQEFPEVNSRIHYCLVNTQLIISGNDILSQR